MKNEKLKIPRRKAFGFLRGRQKLIIIFLVFLLLSLAGQTFAICEGPIVPCGYDKNGNGVIDADEKCAFCHVFVLLNNIINFILTCLTPIAAGLMMVIGGFYFLAAGPSPANVNQAKSVITAAVIGLVIVLVAWVFLNTFLTAIKVADWTGLKEGWWKINCP